MRTKKKLATSITVVAAATCGVWLGLFSAPAAAATPSTTTVTSNVSTGPVSTGGTLIFTATVAGTGGPPVGTVAWTGVTCTATTVLSGGVATCSIDNAQASTAYTATATFTDTDTLFSDSSGFLGPVSPLPAAQAPLTITSTSGTFATPLALTTAGGSGTGAVTYVVDPGGATTAMGCVVTLGALTSTTAGTCVVTATKAADANYSPAVSSPATSISLGALTPTLPTITNIPASPAYLGSFAAAVATTGDGTKSVTSNSPNICTVGPDNLTVTFIELGLCSLTAHVAAGVDYGPLAGTAQSFSVGRATPTLTITNIPTNATEFGSFTASVSTNGDGATSVASISTAVCTVGANGYSVTFVGFGVCTLTANVTQGAFYLAGTGDTQSFPVGPAARGYWLVGSDGGIFSFGAAQFYGSMGSTPLQRPVVGITPSASRTGYWLVASDGGIFSFGSSAYYGSIPGVGLHPAGSGQPHSLNAPIVGMVPSTTGHGYFMVASDGGVFAFGDARFAGSCPGIGGCSGQAVSVMPDSTGKGYWLVTSVGAVYAFGDATYYGAPTPTSVPVVDAVATPDWRGYWLLFANGVVDGFGDATSMGAPVGYVNSFNPATAIFPTADGKGYWVASGRGDVFAYGDSPYLGSEAAAGLNGEIIAAFGF